MSDSARIQAVEALIQRLDRRLTQALHNLDEANFSNDYLARQGVQENSLRQLGYSLDLVRKAQIGEARIENAAISAAKIQRAAISSVHIQEASIGEAALQNASIGEAKIQDGAITNAKIANLAVDGAKIADLSVGTAKITDGAINSAKIADLAVQTANIALGAITQALIQQGAVGNAQIADASITDAKIVELTANKITAGVLEVARLIITGEHSIVSEINAQNNTAQGSTQTIDGGAITQRTVTADRIVANAITAAEIASRTITANEILANTITGAEIKSDSLEARHIKAGEITADKLSSDVGETLNIESNAAIINKVNRGELQGYATDEELSKGLGSVIEQTESSITQRVNEIKTTVIDVDGKLEEFKELVNMWQRFTANGLEMGKSDSPFGTLLSNTRLSFRENGQEIAYFANNKLFVVDAEFDRGLTLGSIGEHFFDFKVGAGGLTLTYRE